MTTLDTIIALERQRRQLYDLTGQRQLSPRELGQLADIGAQIARLWDTRRAELAAQRARQADTDGIVLAREVAV